MRKALSSCLVIVITLITLIAMNTFKSDNSYEASIIEDGVQEGVDKPEGTGLIFEDFDKNINIPINSTNEEKKSPDKVKPEVNDSSTGRINIGRLQGLTQEQIRDFSSQRSAKSYVTLEEFGSNYVDFSVTSQSQSVESVISLQDKASLVKYVKYLSVEDLTEIRRAIDEGADEEELRAIWDTLRAKVPEREYENLVQIVSKYEE